MELAQFKRLCFADEEVEKILINHEKAQEIMQAFHLFDNLLGEMSDVGSHVKKVFIKWDEEYREFIIVMEMDVHLMEGVGLQERIDTAFYPEIDKKLHFCISTVTAEFRGKEAV